MNKKCIGVSLIIPVLFIGCKSDPGFPVDKAILIGEEKIH